MAAAQPHNAALHERSVVVKRTFIEVLDTVPEVLSLGMSGRRASSDSALFENAEKASCVAGACDKRDSADINGEKCDDVDFELSGWSDAETLPEEDGDAWLPCYAHLQSRQVSSSSNPVHDASAGSGEREAPACAEASLQDDAELQRLLAENKRLAQENQLLRESKRRVEAAPVESARGSKAPSHEQIQMYAAMPAVQPHCTGGWWVLAGPAAGDSRDLPLPALPGHDTYMCMPHFEGSGEPVPEEVPLEKRTTVMMRNLPNNYSRAMVLALLDNEGFGGLYDFIYLPIDFKSRACLGYAFVNLVDPQVVSSFWRRFNGYSKWVIPSRKVCSVSWSGPYQGLQAHIERYRNSPVMHGSVPDEYKPATFVDGVQVVFPPPTKTPRAPRMRRGSRAPVEKSSWAW